MEPCILFESEAKIDVLGTLPGVIFRGPGTLKNSENCVTVIIFQLLGILKTNIKKGGKKVMLAMLAMRTLVETPPSVPINKIKNPGTDRSI